MKYTVLPSVTPGICVGLNNSFQKHILNQKLNIMKTLVKIFFMMAIISLVAGCNKDSDTTQKVTNPFKADFSTIEAAEGNGSPCDGTKGSKDTWVSAHQIGEGNGTFLDKFTVDASFCFCLGPDEFGKYIDALFVFTAAHGDTLYGIIEEGLVKVYSEPDENGILAVYKDLLVIKGGTGQFEGATGAAYVDSYLPLPGTHWQHSIDSTITLVKEKKNGK